MADRDIEVITPATVQDLVSLAEVKTFLNISPADISRDPQLALQISAASEIIADMCNRKPPLGFGKSRVREEWREVMNGRLQVMHWPISSTDPIVVSSKGDPFVIDTNYRIDYNSGKISAVGGTWGEPAIIEYTGGFDLPTKAPMVLKKAAALLVQQDRILNQQASVAGMRQISHKESRVAFYDPNALLMKSIGAKTPAMQAVESLIRPYLRIEV